MRFSPFRRRDHESRRRRLRQAGRGRKAPPADECSPLADEVEAWINGELAERRSAGHPQALSPWLVVNRLAHAEPSVLREVADAEPASASPLRRYPTWAAAERSLAKRLVDGATPEVVVQRQRGALVPLELTLIERSKHETLSLGQVLAATLAALGQSRLGPGA
jgi:hypothetical protein